MDKFQDSEIHSHPGFQENLAEQMLWITVQKKDYK